MASFDQRPARSPDAVVAVPEASKADAAPYERDFVTWTEQQASLLRAGRTDLLDIANLAEEIESLGKSQLAALRASYRLIAMHLLKLTHQPERATAGWENTINRERGHAADLLDDNPGLKPRRAELFAKALWERTLGCGLRGPDGRTALPRRAAVHPRADRGQGLLAGGISARHELG